MTPVINKIRFSEKIGSLLVSNIMAPGVGIEPTISTLTAWRCTTQLPRNIFILKPAFFGGYTFMKYNRALNQRYYYYYYC